MRYEDMVTNPDHPFACGLMLKHISAYTTNSKWQPAQLDNSATVIYKVGAIKFLNFQTPENFAVKKPVINLKFKQRCQTLSYYV